MLFLCSLHILLPRDFGIKSAFVLPGTAALVTCFLPEALRLSVPLVSVVSGSSCAHVLWFQMYTDFLCGSGEIVFGSQRMWSVPQVTWWGIRRKI